jgi:triacylglycerol lipase
MSFRAGVVFCGMFFVAACASAPSEIDDAGDADENAADRLAASARGAGYTQTRYPIVLAHGLGGFDRLFGVYEYFYGIPAELRAGGAKVYVTDVSAFGAAEARGEQLLAQVEYIAASTGAGKVNLIGHSQGGIDVRYVLAVRPDLVASVTTVGTPHEGADLADWLVAHTDENGFTGAVLDALGSALGFVLSFLAGTDHPQDAIAALNQLSSAGMSDFNDRFPAGLPAQYCGGGAAQVNGVRLYSWSGASVLTNFLDVGDGPLGIASLFYSAENDGLVARCSAHFGQVLRDDYRMNHLDEVNQVLGLVSIFSTNPKEVFRAHANRLKNAGL